MSDTITDLERIFHPRAISVIGSSSRAGSFWRLFLEGMICMGFPAIYPVHPTEKELLGLKSYPRIKIYRPTSTWQYHCTAHRSP